MSVFFFQFLLHPCQTTRHASQRMVISSNSGQIVSGHPRSTSQGSTNSAVAIFCFLVAVWWAVASCEAQEAAGSTEMATWARHTRHEPPDEVLAEARSKVQRLERAIEVLGDNDSAERQWLTSALEQARRAAQERPAAQQVEECQAFIQRSRNRLLRMEQERVAEQKELDAALVRLTVLLDRIPCVSDVQTAWLLLLFCGATRANY